MAKVARWRKINCCRWVRSDGAVVKWDERTPYSNPVNPNARMWTAWEPDPSQDYVKQLSKRGLGFPKRWKTPEAAMKAIDKSFPPDMPWKEILTERYGN